MLGFIIYHLNKIKILLKIRKERQVFGNLCVSECMCAYIKLN